MSISLLTPQPRKPSFTELPQLDTLKHFCIPDELCFPRFWHRSTTAHDQRSKSLRKICKVNEVNISWVEKVSTTSVINVFNYLEVNLVTVTSFLSFKVKEFMTTMWNICIRKSDLIFNLYVVFFYFSSRNRHYQYLFYYFVTFIQWLQLINPLN